MACRGSRTATRRARARRCRCATRGSGASPTGRAASRRASAAPGTRVAQVQQPRQAARRARVVGQVGDQLVLQRVAVLLLVVRAGTRSSSSPCRRRSGSRACSPCSRRTGPCVSCTASLVKRVGPELARQRQPQRVGAAARQVLLVARDAVARAHRAGVELAAVAVVVAHLDGLGEAAGDVAAGAGRGGRFGHRIVLHVPGRPVEHRRRARCACRAAAPSAARSGTARRRPSSADR